MKTARLERTLELAEAEGTVDVSRDLRFAATLAKQQIQVRSLKTGALLHELKTFEYPAENAVATLEGERIFLVHADSGEKTIDLWQAETISPRIFRLAASGDTTVYDFASEAPLAVAERRGDPPVD